MVTDAVERVVSGAGIGGDDARLVAAVVAAERDAAQVRSWQQCFGTTAGPFSGIGGAAMTPLRVTVVACGRWLVCYAGGTFLAVLDASSAVGRQVWDRQELPGVAVLTGPDAGAPPWGRPDHT